jgi:RNA polymerase sigma-70 factor (ECF subfamily)
MQGPGSTGRPRARPCAAEDAAREAALLLGVARSEGEAFALLYDRLAPRVYGLALRIAGDPGSAQEAMQEAFLRVWLRARLFDPARGSAAAWVLGIVRNAALDLLRSQSAQERARLRAGSAVVAGAPPPDPEGAVARAECGSALRAALGRLPDAQRRTLEIAYFQDLSHAEIARREGVPLGTVKTRIRDGLVRLRRFAQGGPDDG